MNACKVTPRHHLLVIPYLPSHIPLHMWLTYYKIFAEKKVRKVPPVHHLGELSYSLLAELGSRYLNSRCRYLTKKAAALPLLELKK